MNNGHGSHCAVRYEKIEGSSFVFVFGGLAGRDGDGGVNVVIVVVVVCLCAFPEMEG